jgi:hypothetical protein
MRLRYGVSRRTAPASPPILHAMRAGHGSAVTREMERYYALRAEEYDQIYRGPWGPEMTQLKKKTKELFRGKDVLEIAAGTGYWTRELSKTAARVRAEDLNAETLAVGGTARLRLPSELRDRGCLRAGEG